MRVDREIGVARGHLPDLRDVAGAVRAVRALVRAVRAAARAAPARRLRHAVRVPAAVAPPVREALAGLRALDRRRSIAARLVRAAALARDLDDLVVLARAPARRPVVLHL